MKPFRDPKGSVTFPVPLYSGRVLLCRTRATYLQAWHGLGAGTKPRNLADTRGEAVHLYDKQHRSVYLVGVFENGTRTLVHELTHIAFEILSYSGVPISKKNEEAFAYLMDGLYNGATTAKRT